MNQQIILKKSEIFDLLAQQDHLKVQFNNLEQQKTKLLQQLSALMQSESEKSDKKE